MPITNLAPQSLEILRGGRAAGPELEQTTRGTPIYLWTKQGLYFTVLDAH